MARKSAQPEPRLDESLRKLLATDGTFLTLASRVLWALYTKPNSTARQPGAPQQADCSPRQRG